MTFTKDQLIEHAREKIKVLKMSVTQSAFKDIRPELELDLALAEMAMAGMEAEPVAWKAVFKLDGQPGSNFDKIFESRQAMNDVVSLHERGGFIVSVTPLYTAPQPIADMAAQLESARQHIAELEAAPPAPVGEGETPVPLMPDFPGRTLTQRECYRAGFEAGKAAGLPEGYCSMPKKLTAENGAKGALSGEFHVTYRIVCQSCAGEGCEDCNEEGGWDGEIPVGWDTIKRIHEAAVDACALPAAPQQEV